MLYFIAGLALAVLGVTMIWKPEFVYELTESWKHNGSSGPSRLFLWSTRFGGVMCTLAGILGMIVPFIPQI